MVYWLYAILTILHKGGRGGGGAESKLVTKNANLDTHNFGIIVDLRTGNFNQKELNILNAVYKIKLI